MAKGSYTQGLAILLNSPRAIGSIQEQLSGYRVIKQIPDSDEPWFRGPSVVVEYRPEVNGYISVDVVSSPWPDHMGDLKKEPMLFGAWVTGHFGPYAFPFGLKRAAEQSWRWNEAPSAVREHSAFMRLRMSYVFGGQPDAPVIPKDCNPEDELQFLTRMARALLNDQAAICYFNPSGEVLLQKAELDDSLKFHAEHDIPPLDLWSNIRLFRLNERWLLMDSVGNWQLDTPDHEAAFPKDSFLPNDVDRFIRDMTLYVYKNGDVIKNGDTTDGPGNVRWQAKRFEDGVSSPPRSVLRWLPFGQKDIPDILLREKGTQSGRGA